MCCKGKGHTIEECPRDPNFKTGQNVQFEMNRLHKMKDFRTVFAETMAQTTQLLKKSVVVEGGDDNKPVR